MKNYFRRNLAEAAGLFILSTGTGGLVGRVLEIPVLTSWGGSVGVPIPACIVFITVGLVFVFKK